jgi:phytoene synthase
MFGSSLSYGIPGPGVKQKLSYCASMVRRLDRDRFLCALFAPASRREALLALYAFNLEVARIPEVVREPILGSVRLQWWRDTIEGIYNGNPPAHEVAAVLAQAVTGHRLTRDHFDRLLDAREFDLGGQPPDDVPALLAYVEATSGGLTSLALEILDSGEGNRRAAEGAGREVAIAWALTGLLRAVPFHARARRVYLPKSLMDREGVSAADVLALRPSPGLAAVVREIADLARQHLAAARQHERAAPEWARPALLPGVLASSHLSRIERAKFNPLELPNETGGLRRQLRLWLAAVRGKF